MPAQLSPPDSNAIFYTCLDAPFLGPRSASVSMGRGIENIGFEASDRGQSDSAKHGAWAESSDDS